MRAFQSYYQIQVLHSPPRYCYNDYSQEQWASHLQTRCAEQSSLGTPDVNDVSISGPDRVDGVLLQFGRHHRG